MASSDFSEEVFFYFFSSLFILHFNSYLFFFLLPEQKKKSQKRKLADCIFSAKNGSRFPKARKLASYACSNSPRFFTENAPDFLYAPKVRSDLYPITQTVNSQFSILNFQFSIFNSQFSILNLKPLITLTSFTPGVTSNLLLRS